MVSLQIIEVDTAEPELYFFQAFFFPSTFPTMHHPPSDINGGNSSGYMQHSLEPQKALFFYYYFFLTYAFLPKMLLFIYKI